MRQQKSCLGLSNATGTSVHGGAAELQLSGWPRTYAMLTASWVATTCCGAALPALAHCHNRRSGEAAACLLPKGGRHRGVGLSHGQGILVAPALHEPLGPVVAVWQHARHHVLQHIAHLVHPLQTLLHEVLKHGKQLAAQLHCPSDKRFCGGLRLHASGRVSGGHSPRDSTCGDTM